MINIFVECDHCAVIVIVCQLEIPYAEKIRRVQESTPRGLMDSPKWMSPLSRSRKLFYDYTNVHWGYLVAGYTVHTRTHSVQILDTVGTWWTGWEAAEPLRRRHSRVTSERETQETFYSKCVSKGRFISLIWVGFFWLRSVQQHSAEEIVTDSEPNWNSRRLQNRQNWRRRRVWFGSVWLVDWNISIFRRRYATIWPVMSKKVGLLAEDCDGIDRLEEIWLWTVANKNKRQRLSSISGRVVKTKRSNRNNSQYFNTIFCIQWQICNVTVSLNCNAK